MESPLKVSVIVVTAVATVVVGAVGVQFLATLNDTAILENSSTSLLNESDFSTDSRLAAGDQFFAAGDYDAAIEQYTFATQLDPNNAAAFLKWGTTLLKQHETEEALEILNTAYTLAPNASSASDYAHALMINTQWEEAEKVLSSVDVVDQKLLYTKALYNVLQNHPENAKKQFQEALDLGGPLTPALFQNFLSNYQLFEQAQGAEENYRDALLCKSLVDAEEYELAALLSHQVLSKKNDYRDVWMLLGYSEYKLGKFTDAEDAFRQAKKIDSVKPEVHYFLGAVLTEQKKYKEGIAELELALLYDFSPAEEAYKKVAEAHKALGEWNESVTAYEALLNLNPSSSYAFKDAVEICLTSLNDKDRALTLAQKATSIFPSEALSHTLLAKVYLAQEQLELASSEINTAFDIDPNFVEAHYTAGEIRLAQNNTEGAKWEFKKTFELSSEDDPLHSAAAEQYNALLNASNSAANSPTP